MENSQQTCDRVALKFASALAEDLDTAETGYHQKMADDGLVLARELGRTASQRHAPVLIARPNRN
ncbi:MAG: hypothetical protein KDN22_25930 [Verrucomicrobiae bacterium]|nr:hypothetical protein [Verrucomicrobiae bacterium]